MSERIEILIAKFVSNNISDEEKDELMLWVSQSPENIDELERIDKLWNISFNLKKQNEIDVEKAWTEFKLLTESPQIKKVEKTKFMPLKIAAAITLLIVTSLVIKFYISRSSVTPGTKISKNLVAMISIYTTDSIKKFLLPDSSLIFLNKNSRFMYPKIFSKYERITFLTGEAFFNVKHSSVPFVAFCQKTRTKDLGTSFNIKGYDKDKEVEVIVVTGKVELSNKDAADSDKMILTENERGTFNKEEHSFERSKNKRKDFKWWQKDNLFKKIK